MNMSDMDDGTSCEKGFWRHRYNPQRYHVKYPLLIASILLQLLILSYASSPSLPSLSPSRGAGSAFSNKVRPFGIGGSRTRKTENNMNVNDNSSDDLASEHDDYQNLVEDPNKSQRRTNGDESGEFDRDPGDDKDGLIGGTTGDYEEDIGDVVKALLTDDVVIDLDLPPSKKDKGSFGSTSSKVYGRRQPSSSSSSSSSPSRSSSSSTLPSSSSSYKQDKASLYDAYNQLHTLAQEYAKPFDAPAVVVVGHQSSGKSALIEALMGFQFNQVGGGTKTRRPVALRMQYNPQCIQPRWFLVGEDGVEKPMLLTEIQDHIDRENRRLERDPVRSFESREINIRMEYRHCPNMILIDTPGLISAPRIPKGRSGSGAALAQQRALQAAAREAERLVVEKMRCEDYIILCVEDTNDWKHGTTREIVQKADPDLTRTVVVNTKFDTKVPQFGTPRDVEDFLRASILERISPHRLGGPFFTSVPSGRVGRRNALNDNNNYDDFLFDSDEDFVSHCSDSENSDRAVVSQRLKRIGGGKGTGEVGNAAVMSRIGLSKLKKFLEQRVDECYRRNVAKIIPMLQAEYVAAERRLQACENELEALSVERLKAGADTFCDEFCNCLRKSIHGSVVAPATLFGETLAQETSAAGSFHDIQGCPMAVSDRTWDLLIEQEVGNRNHRLYGGSQYHRALREFNLASKCLRLHSISDDEIANAAGIGETHDGVNFLHAACVIALEKARVSFEPLLGSLQIRMNHVMGRLCPVAEYMLRENRDRVKVSTYRQYSDNPSSQNSNYNDDAMDISQNPQFRQLIRSIFDKFVQKCSDSAMSKCRDDLTALTKYVSWNLNQGGSASFTRALPDQTDVVGVYHVALQSSARIGESPPNNNNNNNNKRGSDKHQNDRGGVGTLSSSDDSVLRPVSDNHNNQISSKVGGVDSEYRNLLLLMEEAVMSRNSNRTSILVGGLVQHIVAHWREQFCRSVTTKFNCYFMLPFVDEFHRFIRRELQNMYDEGSNSSNDLSDVFDLTTARRSLQVQREELIGECMANKALQDKFQECSRMMRKQQEKDSPLFNSKLRRAAAAEGENTLLDD